MRLLEYLGIIFLLIYTSSCEKSRKREDEIKGVPWENSYRTEVIVLEDSFVKIIADIPIELDTFYTRLNSSDNDCGHKRQYTFSDSDYPIFIREGGSLGDILPDSAYEFTIYHTYKFACSPEYPRDYDEEDFLLKARGTEIFRTSEGKPFKWIHKEFKKISGRPFMIMAYQTNYPARTPNQTYLSTYLNAYTQLDSLHIGISYECNAKDCEGFVERMMNSLESIKLEKL